MMTGYYNNCAKCNSPEHHTIECTIGEDPIHYNVINANVDVKCEEESSSQLTREDVSTEGNLINFDEDVKSFGAQSSHTSYENDLKNLTIDPVNTKSSCEQSSASPDYDPHFQKDLDEAIRRSLKDMEAQDANESGGPSYATKEQASAFATNEEQILSDNEDFNDMIYKSVEKVMGWNVGVGDGDGDGDNNGGGKGKGKGKAVTSVSTIDSEDYHERIDDARHWEAKATPKTLRSRELVPASSFIAFQSTTSTEKGRGRVRNSKRRSIEPVTRTLNQGTNTMTVSSLRQKRRDRRSQRSYYDITPELQYLR